MDTDSVGTVGIIDGDTKVGSKVPGTAEGRKPAEGISEGLRDGAVGENGGSVVGDPGDEFPEENGGGLIGGTIGMDGAALLGSFVGAMNVAFDGGVDEESVAELGGVIDGAGVPEKPEGERVTFDADVRDGESIEGSGDGLEDESGVWRDVGYTVWRGIDMEKSTSMDSNTQPRSEP